MGANHAETADQTADRQIDEHTFLPIPRRHPDCGEDGAQYDDAGVGEETGLDDVVLHLLDVGDSRLLRRIKGDDDGADDADEAADLADEGEAFLEEDGGQDGRDDDAQRPQRGNEDRISERVGNKIADLAQNHKRHARPPPGVLEVAVSFTRLLVVLEVGFQQADFLQHERHADEEAGADSQTYADNFVDGRAGDGLGG